MTPSPTTPTRDPQELTPQTQPRGACLPGEAQNFAENLDVMIVPAVAPGPEALRAALRVEVAWRVWPALVFRAVSGQTESDPDP